MITNEMMESAKEHFNMFSKSLIYPIRFGMSGSEYITRKQVEEHFKEVEKPIEPVFTQKDMFMCWMASAKYSEEIKHPDTQNFDEWISDYLTSKQAK